MSSPMYSTEPQPQRSGLTTALVAGAMIALLAAVIYLFVQMDHMQTDMAKMKEQFNTELTSEKDRARLRRRRTRSASIIEVELETTKSELATETKNLSAQAKWKPPRMPMPSPSRLPRKRPS